MRDEAPARALGRPRVGPPVNVRLPVELHDALCRVALRTGETVSDVIRRGCATVVQNSTRRDPAPQ